jgi:hypothetical protein
MRGLRRLGLAGLVGCVILGCGTARGAAEQRESWDALFIAGKKVGYIHTTVEPVKAGDGRDLLRVQVQTQLRFKRLNDTVTLQTRYGTVETPTGSVLRLDARSLVGPNEMRVYGDVVDGKIDLTLDGGGSRQALTLDWPEDARGPYGPEQSMSRQPMKAGETRQVKTFIPDLNQLGLTELMARGDESIVLGGGAKMNLLRVDSKVSGPGGKVLPGMDTTYWVDESGQILKSQTDVFGGLETFRTTKDAALSAIKSPLDLVKVSIVPVGRRINRPEATREAVYKVTLIGEKAEEIFPTDQRQAVKAAPEGGSLLEVRTAGIAGSAPPADAPGPEFLDANPVINSADAGVVRHMKTAVGSQTDPLAKASMINQWVFENVKEKNFETSFATASDVARDLSGDCSEHAVLMAAMCRAAGLPARAVIGLVYAERLEGFGYHMWVEVFANGNWVAFDPTFGQSEVDAAHLKLTDSSLAGVSPYESFLDVARVFSKLKLDPVEIR